MTSKTLIKYTTRIWDEFSAREEKQQKHKPVTAKILIKDINMVMS